jgi:hypothetical protein
MHRQVKVLDIGFVLSVDALPGFGRGAAVCWFQNMFLTYESERNHKLIRSIGPENEVLHRTDVENLTAL